MFHWSERSEEEGKNGDMYQRPLTACSTSVALVLSFSPVRILRGRSYRPCPRLGPRLGPRLQPRGRWIDRRIVDSSGHVARFAVVLLVHGGANEWKAKQERRRSPTRGERRRGGSTLSRAVNRSSIEKRDALRSFFLSHRSPLLIASLYLAVVER